MILVDTSVWIDWLNGRLPRPAPGDLSKVATCGPILQEILQGLDDSKSAKVLRIRLEHLILLSDPLPLSLFVEAATIYGEGRRRGFTIRSAVDCLIAAIAIEHDVPLLHSDRDFDTIALFTPLQAVRLGVSFA